MKTIKMLCLVFVCLICFGCSVNPSKIGGSEADGFLENITYVEDEDVDICFAIVASRKSFDFNSSGFGITTVPCNKLHGMVKQLYRR